ncbi:calmodulin-binding protein 60 B-like [Salvia splendens]|uniref:calmodulin-binding protein 60 B-like n=1 Tax=Salvia splendens TaxID=180675 RepID=UPI001C26AE68|nr:calmodulin-binding protein 60 B-like [Salvia splendens]
MEDQYMKIVEEELELAKRRIDARMKSSCPKDASMMKVEFRNRIVRMILTGEEIKGEGEVPIEVALVDDVTGDVVVDEPEATAKVEFYLLNVCGAEELIVPQGEGKLPILAGNVPLQLHRGVAKINNLKIRNYATKIKPPVFKLGARVVGASVRVKEAKTEAFTLKDFRIKYFKKHKNPSLSDEVSRLVFIRRGGKINGRLQDNNIHTVEDFLIRLLIDPQSLKSIVKTQAKKWKAIVNNAQACLVSERVYCYIDPKQKTGVVFNILGGVQGLCSGSHYYSQTSTLSEKHKVDAEKLLASAYQNWNEVKAFDDQNSLQQHLDERTEMVGEDVGSMDDEIDVVYDAAMQSPHDWPWSPSLFEGLRSESNGDEPRMVVGSGNSPRMWRKVVCVSKWLSLRRRVALLHLTPTPKKQRIV